MLFRSHGTCGTEIRALPRGGQVHHEGERTAAAAAHVLWTGTGAGGLYLRNGQEVLLLDRAGASVLPGRSIADKGLIGAWPTGAYPTGAYPTGHCR